MTTTDYYKVLGVEKGASSTEIKQAYKKLAIRFHPDRNPDDDRAAEKMAKLNEAYAVLSNPEKRSSYDGLRDRFGDGAAGHFRQNHSYEDILRESDIEKIFQEIADNFGIRGFNELFKAGNRHGGFFMFGTFGGGMPFRKKGGHGRLGGRHRTMGGNLLQGVAGTLLKNVFSQAVGRVGTGRDIFDTITLSPDHARAGGPYAYYHRQKDKKLIVKIPPNIQEGRKIRLKGQGNPDPVTGEIGDLFLTIVVKTSLVSRLKKKLLK